MIVLLFTGGTISMRHDPTSGGAIPSLSGRDILALAPAIAQIADIEIVDWGTHPGPHMTTERMWALRSVLAEQLARSEVQGIVVTHGTDSLEESAYLVARSLPTTKPIVFTGAMRTSSDRTTSGGISSVSGSMRAGREAGAVGEWTAAAGAAPAVALW